MSQEVRGQAQQAWFRALDHARLTGVKPCYRVGGFYTVDSPRSGTRCRIEREIYADHVGYACSCTAAASGKVCWHAALVAALPYERELRAELKELGVRR